MSNTSSKNFYRNFVSRLPYFSNEKNICTISKKYRYRLTNTFISKFILFSLSFLSPDKSARVISFYVHVVGQHAAYPTLFLSWPIFIRGVIIPPWFFPSSYPPLEERAIVALEGTAWFELKRVFPPLLPLHA